MHVQCPDITHDVKAPPDDVRSKNKRCTLDTELPKNGCQTQGRDHPDCRVVHPMPHPPLRIWACPHDWSLQPLYLHYITMLCILFTNLQIYRSQDRVALTPHQLKVPPPLTPMHAPKQQFLVATPAPAGSNIQGSGHQLWHWSPTAGHQKQEVLPHP